MGSISWSRDAIERVLWTVVQVVVAAALTAATEAFLGSETLDATSVKAIVLAAWAGALAALKAFVAKSISGTISPASTAKAG